MCGLVGIYSSNMLMKHKKVLSDLLFLDTFRGRDSTGVAAIRKNTDTSVIKQTIPGYEFVEGPRLDQHLNLGDFCWIGHNRYGTIGKNIKSNAHPFMVTDEDGCCFLVGAHNGTLKSKHKLPNHQQYGTDSEALFNAISEQGLEEVLKELEGAWALTWYDHLEEELRFLRNDQRTLFYAWEEGRETILWASEQWMIRVACSRNGVKLENDQVSSVAENTLYRMPAPLKWKEELTLERKGGMAGKAPGFFQNVKTGGNHAKVVTRPSQLASTNGVQKQKPTKKDESKVVNINSSKTYKGYGNHRLTKAQLEKELVDGCAWCEEESIEVNDRFGWLAKGVPICSKCIDGVHVDTEATPEEENEAVKASRLIH